MSPIILSNGAYSAVIEPENGGLISALRWQKQDLTIDLLYSPAARPKSANGIHLLGCWPLVPFANRAFEAMLRYNNKEIKLPINDPASASTMHGFGWQNKWNVIEHTAHSIVLQHHSEDGFYPFHYTAKMIVALDENGALFSLNVTNTGNEPLPYGLGFHPWFNCDEHTLFSAKADGMVELGLGYRPQGKLALDAYSDFSKPKPVRINAEIAINYCHWNGDARLEYPASHYIQIEAGETLRTPVLWTPGNTDYICFEPQSHAIGAPSELAAQAVSPMKILAPKEYLEGWMRIGAIEL